MALDAASLEAITQEIRTCFLYEDAPDLISTLERGIRQLIAFDSSGDHIAEYTALMRAAHSLKGGAGIAQFLTVSRLAHLLEDLLQALGQEQVQPAPALELLSVSVEQITTFIAAATSTTDGTVDVALETSLLPIITQIENFLQPNQKKQGEQRGTGTQGQRSHASAGVEEFEQSGVGRGEENHSPLTPSPFHPSPLTPHPSPLTPEDTKDLGLHRLNLRMPVSRLERIDNTIGELFISYERLAVYQEQLQQVDRTLKQRAARLTPLSEQVQAIYDNLVISPPRETVAAPDLLEGDSPKESFSQSADATKIQNTLQDLQELIVQVHEARSDVELLTSEFRETLAQLRYQLDDLRSDVTEARLVRFDFLAAQFVAAQQSFSQRYHKSVELVIDGKETPIDRVILEQLKIPLLHLFRNAFAHGIETPQTRQAHGKSPTAKITLGATIVANRIVVTLADDGGGIDISAIHQKAIDLGLCEATTPLSKEQILEFLFQPGFSTATSVTSVAGRGLGLDIVKLQVEKLRGTVVVETEQAQGTKFTITIPLILNILPLLLCKCQQQTLAIPAAKVKQVIALSEFAQVMHSSKITWGDRSIPVYSLIHLLPYHQARIIPPSSLNCDLGIVLEVDEMVIVLAVNSLLGERELVIKPFDSTLKVPAYILGGAILGTGEVVPVLSPENFGELIAQADKKQLARDTKPDSGAVKILIVDDAIAFRRILERILTSTGYEVIQCRDGKDALDKLYTSNERFDLVISDIEMPRIDGLELLRQIRTDPVWHSLPVVILSARENQWHRQTATDLGATQYLTKPFRTDELLCAIATIVSTI